MNFRDITERKLADASARARAAAAAGAEDEAVGRLAGGIAHDFNNILGGILGYAEMLVEQTAAGSPFKRYAQNVLTAANRARGLVDQILAYSRQPARQARRRRSQPHRRRDAGARARLAGPRDQP